MQLNLVKALDEDTSVFSSYFFFTRPYTEFNNIRSFMYIITTSNKAGKRSATAPTCLSSMYVVHLGHSERVQQLANPENQTNI